MRGKLIIRHFYGPSGQGKGKNNLRHSWSGNIKVAPDRLKPKRISLQLDIVLDTLPVRLHTDRKQRLVCTIDSRLGRIGFYFNFSEAGDSYTVRGRFADGQYAPLYSCSFRKANESWWRVWLKRLRW